MKKNILLIVVILIVFLFYSCGTMAPFTEKKLAEETIAKANSVNAIKYSPDFYKKALKSYTNGKVLIIPKKKHGDNTKAKAEFLVSIQSASNAYQISIIPFTEKHINETYEKIELAREEKVDIVSKYLFENSVTINNKAKTNLIENQYDTAISNTLNAREILEKAYSNKKIIKSKLDKYELKTVNLINYADDMKANIVTKNEYKNITDDHLVINSQTKQGLYHKSLEEYPKLINSIREMLKIIETKRKLAHKELKEASEVIEQIKNTSKIVDEEIKLLNQKDQNN